VRVVGFGVGLEGLHYTIENINWLSEVGCVFGLNNKK
jgi:hypothetical protein